MARLRERKKKETRARIVAAAARLFAEKGFDAATMEEIAAAADAGVGTLYNYFRAKERVLLGVYEAQTDLFLERGREVVDSPGPDPIAAACRLFAVYMPMATAFDKGVMREMLARSLLQPPEALEEMASLDVKLAAQVGDLLAALAASGAVARDIEIQSASVALYGAFVLPLMLFLSMPAMSTTELETMVEAQVRTIFAGLLPR